MERNLEYDNEGNLSFVRTNLMNQENYSGYCGNSWNEQKKKGCDMPRTKWIPVHIKEPVIYTRYRTSGYSGGNYRGGCAEYFDEKEPDNKHRIIEMVLEILKPDIKFIQYKKIISMIRTNKETKYEYYGNSNDYKVEYIILSELEDYLNEI